MKKTTNSNPLKYFNDAAADRKKSVTAGNNKLMKAQVGTAFQSYLKNVPNSSPSDTLGVNDPRTFNFGYPTGDKKTNALAGAFQATYGNDHSRSFTDKYADYTEKELRIPQTKKTVKAYTKSIPTSIPSNKYEDVRVKKTGGAVKSKKK